MLPLVVKAFWRLSVLATTNPNRSAWRITIAYSSWRRIQAVLEEWLCVASVVTPNKIDKCNTPDTILVGKKRSADFLLR